MLAFSIKENIDLWAYLQSVGKPIVLYGTGNGADKILDTLEAYGIKVSDIFMSNDFFREDATFRGFKLLSYDDIKCKYDDCVIVLAFAVFRRDMLKRISEMSKEYELRAPCVSVFGSDYFSMETLEKYESEINKAYSLLSDDLSREVFVKSLEYRISGKIDYLFDCQTERDEVFSNVIKLSSDEVYVDLGAYRGDTIEEFLLMTHGKYKKIYALEPDSKNYAKLIENMGTLDNAEFLNKASWCDERVMNFEGGGGRNSNLVNQNIEKPEVVHTIDVDSVLAGERATYIKMDVEGAEHETLRGLKKTLIEFKPKLIVSGYHRTCDLFTLPILINEINPEYKIYLRHHPYIPDWESNYYCI